MNVGYKIRQFGAKESFDQIHSPAPLNVEFKKRQFGAKKACSSRECIGILDRKDSFFSPNSRFLIQRGFLIIEVMIALGLFALAVTVLSQACINAIRANEIIAQKEPAFEDFTFLYNVVLAKFDKSHMDASGDIQCPQSGMARWNVHWKPTDVVDLFSGVVEATFDLPGLDKPMVYEQAACIYRPGSMTASDRQGLIDKAKSKRLAKKKEQE